MKKLVKKPVFKKNQMIITALAGMIAIAGYLNYAGTDVNPSLMWLRQIWRRIFPQKIPTL